MHWTGLGWLGGIFIAYAVAKSLIPDAEWLIATAAIVGGGIMGAVFGKIANG